MSEIDEIRDLRARHPEAIWERYVVRERRELLASDGLEDVLAATTMPTLLLGGGPVVEVSSPA